MARAAGMHHRLGVRQVPHELTRSARVVQMETIPSTKWFSDRMT